MIAEAPPLPRRAGPVLVVAFALMALGPAARGPTGDGGAHAGCGQGAIGGIAAVGGAGAIAVKGLSTCDDAARVAVHADDVAHLGGLGDDAARLGGLGDDGLRGLGPAERIGATAGEGTVDLAAFPELAGRDLDLVLAEVRATGARTPAEVEALAARRGVAVEADGGALVLSEATPEGVRRVRVDLDRLGDLGEIGLDLVQDPEDDGR